MCHPPQGHSRTLFNERRTIFGQPASTADGKRSTAPVVQVPWGPDFATCMGSMARLIFVVVAIGAVSVGCSANTATQERQPDPMRAQAVSTPAPLTVPDNHADRSIRRDLSLAIARHADLHNREISFIVTNGDIRVTGVVRTEDERRKINDLAMNIDGVKSVSNALRVAE